MPETSGFCQVFRVTSAKIVFFFFGPPLPSPAKAMSHHHVTKIVHSGNIRRETDCDGQRTCFIDPFASIKVRTTSLIKILQGTAYC